MGRGRQPRPGQEAGSFLSDYAANRREACAAALDDSPVTEAIRLLVDYSQEPWHGTASELLSCLGTMVPRQVRSSGGWPKAPRALGMMLRQISPQLSAIDIGVKFDRGRAARMITIERIG